MKLRKIDDELEARACLVEVARSGERLATWARSRGIDGRSLHAWEMNLRRGTGAPRRLRPSKGAPSLTLIELVPTTSSTPRYVLAVGAASVEFGNDFDEMTLRRVIGVLRSC